MHIIPESIDISINEFILVISIHDWNNFLRILKIGIEKLEIKLICFDSKNKQFIVQLLIKRIEFFMQIFGPFHHFWNKLFSLFPCLCGHICVIWYYIISLSIYLEFFSKPFSNQLVTLT